MRRLTRHTKLAIRRMDHVRRGVSVPSLTPLVGVTHTLKMHLNAFLSSRADRTKPIVYHGNRTSSAVKFSGGTARTHRRVRCRSLSGDGISHRVRPFVVSVSTGSRGSFFLSTRRKRRFVVMLGKRLRVDCKGDGCHLGRKSAVCCSSVMPRRMRATRKRTTRVLTMICAPMWISRGSSAAYCGFLGGR